MKANFGLGSSMTPKELGQLKALRLHLGDLTREVIEWIVDPVNWWHFCQQVRAELKINLPLPNYPHVGFLLGHRGTALRVMRSKLCNSSTGADFIKRLDQREYEQTKTLLLVCAAGTPERLAKIEEAKTLTDIQRVFIEIVDESTETQE
jgi:hypothetical protein